jgi:hypothetical protein
LISIPDGATIDGCVFKIVPVPVNDTGTFKGWTTRELGEDAGWSDVLSGPR